MKKTNTPTLACVVGTRPEVIKIAPIASLLKQSNWCRVILINTAQHRDLLAEVFALFKLTPDFCLDSMVDYQSLGSLTARLCQKLDDLLHQIDIDVVLAVGDTTSALTSALIAFYHKISFAHIEAGLRTDDPFSPFPEEINRKLIASLATWHFAPTATERDNLLRENIAPRHITITGNPVVDALHSILKQQKKRSDVQENHNLIRSFEHLVVLTVHRRENFGLHLKNICDAVLELLAEFSTLNFVVPLHPNPLVKAQVASILSGHARIQLIEALSYDRFIHLINRASFIMSDSGGIQEEAPALNKPILILREITERPAIVTNGLGLLVGTQKTNIVQAVRQLLTDNTQLIAMQKGLSPYGDGKAAQRIVSDLRNRIKAQKICRDEAIAEA